MIMHNINLFEGYYPICLSAEGSNIRACFKPFYIGFIYIG